MNQSHDTGMLRDAMGGVAHLGGGAMRIWGALEMMKGAAKMVIPGGENGISDLKEGAIHTGMGWLSQKAAPMIDNDGSLAGPGGEAPGKPTIGSLLEEPESLENTMREAMGHQQASPTTEQSSMSV